VLPNDARLRRRPDELKMPCNLQYELLLANQGYEAISRVIRLAVRDLDYCVGF